MSSVLLHTAEEAVTLSAQAVRRLLERETVKGEV